MATKLAHISYVVDDYDRAIEYFTQVLEFQLIEDLDMGVGKRWVLVAPYGQSGCSFLLAKAQGSRQISAIGNQFGGRVGLFLETEDFANDYAKLKQNGVNFTEAPRHEKYGVVVVFEDIYGTRWDLIEYAKN